MVNEKRSDVHKIVCPKYRTANHAPSPQRALPLQLVFRRGKIRTTLNFVLAMSIVEFVGVVRRFRGLTIKLQFHPPPRKSVNFEEVLPILQFLSSWAPFGVGGLINSVGVSKFCGPKVYGRLDFSESKGNTKSSQQPFLNSHYKNVAVTSVGGQVWVKISKDPQF